MTASHAIPELAGFRAGTPLLVTDVAVLDPADGTVTTHQDILIEHGLVTRVAAAITADADVLDGAGSLALPGFWDMRVHTFDEASLPKFLRQGVTGIRHVGGAPIHQQWRNRLRASDWLAPRMVFASPIVDGPRPTRPGSIAVADADEGPAAVHRCLADDAHCPHWTQ
ncbi:hypothetical protein [Kutzneria sp. 744]|uniref:hypothetical protein n=1 Tax=Kutzneria sp. (strain 744) TaxID=345341 RepID=UPI0004ADE6FC|nr:hypothetical protein [Kutzneria sp. 744]